ncbi:carboxylate-amine ligase [Kutzneria kofuensis]|uniref:Putative glutamate--cysteine ligase 2 n=1 Tax=Kutzneria kofuensis TaxID=103725 RepID=A0A7W9KR13_9PSEU|nr:glutamate--cysteine ligase [Kutzneria kofuensis]MBB5897116.1 carboxylate-amine ligase [Kutzneria kofuensis]
MADSGLTFGVEEEFLVVDATGRPVPAGRSVLGGSGGETDELQHEMIACQVESATPVCTGVGELLGHLCRLRETLSASARERDLRLIASGTPPLPEATPPPLTSERRYHQIASHFRSLLKSANVCGCHVHVGVPDRETGLHVLNHLRPWLPVLLAVSANSPFNDGADTGYASWRHMQMSNWPSAGPPPYLRSLDEYDSTLDTMTRSGALLDPAMAYWDIRLSPTYPTVEIRVCDVTITAQEAALIAVLVRGLVALALLTDDDAPEVAQEVIRADLWLSARDGLRGRCAAPSGSPPEFHALDRLVAEVRPVLDDEDQDFVERVTRQLGRVGAGASRQLAAFARAGKPEDVVTMLAEATVPCDAPACP